MPENSADIGKQQIAAVYAKALLGAAENAHTTDAVVEELDSFVDDVLTRFPHFEIVIGSPRISQDEKTQLIDRVLGSRASENLLVFLKVLNQHERLDCLRQIRGEVRRQFNELRNRVEVEVTTAHGLPDDLRQQIIDKLRERLGCEVDLTAKTEESLIGGLVVRVGDTVVDGSVRNKLAQMRGQAVQRVVEQIHEQGARFADLSTSP